MAVPFPKTVGLIISVHGKIVVPPGDEFTSFVPDMDVVKISAVAPGVCNLMDAAGSMARMQIMLSSLRDLGFRDDIATEQLKHIATTIAERLKAETSERDKVLGATPADEHHYALKQSAHFKPYIELFDRRYSVNSSTTQEEPLQLINKMLTRSQEDSADTFQIRLIFPGTDEGGAEHPPRLSGDMFRHFQDDLRSNDERQVTTIKEILDTLKDLGVERVLIFDFSCEEFQRSEQHKEDGYVVTSYTTEPERGVRNLRRRLSPGPKEKRTHFGGRRKTKRTHRKKSSPTKRRPNY